MLEVNGKDEKNLNDTYLKELEFLVISNPYVSPILIHVSGEY